MTKTAKTTAKKPSKDRVAELELRYLPKMYQAWEKVQALMNQMDAELNMKRQPQELMHFDFACSRMEEAFNKLEAEIEARAKKQEE
jgi:hypothetical protein